eukprot:13530-Heterococcus_DN1.PRE.6
MQQCMLHLINHMLRLVSYSSAGTGYSHAQCCRSKAARRSIMVDSGEGCATPTAVYRRRVTHLLQGLSIKLQHA